MTLIERIEAAKGPDRELDVEIAFASGWRMRDGYWIWPKRFRLPIGNLAEPPFFTGSIDAAETLVLDGYQWSVGSCGENDGPWACVELHDFDKGCPDFTGTGETEALALCAAALRAKEATSA